MWTGIPLEIAGWEGAEEGHELTRAVLYYAGFKTHYYNTWSESERCARIECVRRFLLHGGTELAYSVNSCEPRTCRWRCLEYCRVTDEGKEKRVTVAWPSCPHSQNLNDKEDHAAIEQTLELAMPLEEAARRHWYGRGVRVHSKLDHRTS